MGSKFINVKLLIVSTILASCTGQIVPDLGSVEEAKAVPVSAPADTVFSGNFTTEEIRGLWGTCSTSFYNNNPYYPEELTVLHCDCYTDYTRSNYKDHEELAAMTPEGGAELRENLITNCNLKIQQDQLNLKPNEQT